MRLPPGLCPGPRWGGLQRPPDPQLEKVGLHTNPSASPPLSYPDLRPWRQLSFVNNIDKHERLLFPCRPSRSSVVLYRLCMEARVQIMSMTSRGRESTKLCGDFAVYITSIIMMLITILLMIEDRCNTSFAQNYCYVGLHISFIRPIGLGDENGCNTNSAIGLQPS